MVCGCVGVCVHVMPGVAGTKEHELLLNLVSNFLA